MNTARRRAQLPARDTATTAAANPTRQNDLSQRIAALNELTAQQLRDEWRRLYRGQPPRLSRDLLIRTELKAPVALPGPPPRDMRPQQLALRPSDGPWMPGRVDRVDTW